MSRIHSDREDLLRDAAALRIRGEFCVPGLVESVVAGCRDNGNWSVYFGQDPCYHFDSHGRLRRAFVGDRLYRTHGATLAELRRVRAPEGTQLLRNDLDAKELASFLNEMQHHLTRLHDALQSGAATLVRSVPEESQVGAMLTQFLGNVLDPAPVLAPPIRTRPR